MLGKLLVRGAPLQAAIGNLAAKLALVVLGLGITFTVARVGPQMQGAFSLFVACESVLLTLFSGFGIALAREVSHNRGDAAPALTAALLSSLGVGLLAALVACGIAWAVPREPYGHLWLLGLAAPFLLLVPTATGLWMGQARMLPLNLAQMAAPASVLGLLGALALTRGLSPAVTGLVLTCWVLGKSVVGLMTAGWAFHDAGGSAPGWALLGRDLRFVATIGLTNVVSLLNYRVALFLVEYQLGLEAAGIYSIAVQVGELLWLASSSISVAFYRAIGQPDGQAAAAETIRAIRWSLGLAAAAAPVLVALAYTVLPMVLGERYRASAPVLLCLVPGLTAYAAGSALGAYFTNHMGRPQLSGMVATFSMLLGALASWVLTPRLGLTGAALGTTLSYTLAITLGYLIFCRESGLPRRALWTLRLAPHSGSRVS